MPTLSILIPTYNRVHKLLRLLKNIETEIVDTNISDPIHVIVSDNGSSDDTQTEILHFKATKYKFSYFRQEKNIGFDGNVRFLYNKADTDYVWLFADDDILLPGAISMVIKGLKETGPDVLLFSFIQPPGSEFRTFNLPGQFEVITDPKEIIKFVVKYMKISIYVLRKIEFNEAQRTELVPFYENGYFFVDLCYSVISTADKPRLCIISQPLATCDDDYINIRYGTGIFLGMFNIFYHPFVRTHLPNMAKEYRIQSYYSAIQLMFAVKMGSLKSDDPAFFEKEIRSFKIMPYLLLKSPRAFMQLLLLKLGLVWLYKEYKRYLGLLQKSTHQPSAGPGRMDVD